MQGALSLDRRGHSNFARKLWTDPYLNALAQSSNQPAISNKPPNGVIMANAVTSVSTRA